MKDQDNPDENMRIWNRVCETDPKHTKEVSLGRRFTSIDAQYLVKKATEAFGPVGMGWGWMNTVTIHDGEFVLCEVTIWHKNQSHFFGPFASIQPIKLKGGRIDSDAPKKATTDALTKGLSHLGFGADVFLGQYDDNKYVAEMRQKYAEGPEVPMEDMKPERHEQQEVKGNGEFEL